MLVVVLPAQAADRSAARRVSSSATDPTPDSCQQDRVPETDEDGNFRDRVNLERVLLESLTDEDEALIQRLVGRHFQYTRSKRADDVLRKWNDYAPKFVKVLPKDLALAVADRLTAHTGDG